MFGFIIAKDVGFRGEWVKNIASCFAPPPIPLNKLKKLHPLTFCKMYPLIHTEECFYVGGSKHLLDS